MADFLTENSSVITNLNTSVNKLYGLSVGILGCDLNYTVFTASSGTTKTLYIGTGSTYARATGYGLCNLFATSDIVIVRHWTGTNMLTNNYPTSIVTFHDSIPFISRAPAAGITDAYFEFDLPYKSGSTSKMKYYKVIYNPQDSSTYVNAIWVG